MLVKFDFPEDTRRSFTIDLRTMTLRDKLGRVYEGVYAWKGMQLGTQKMAETDVKKIDFTKIAYPALDGSDLHHRYMRFEVPVDGEEMLVYFRQVEEVDPAVVYLGTEFVNRVADLTSVDGQPPAPVVLVVDLTNDPDA